MHTLLEYVPSPPDDKNILGPRGPPRAVTSVQSQLVTRSPGRTTPAVTQARRGYTRRHVLPIGRNGRNEGVSATPGFPATATGACRRRRVVPSFLSLPPRKASSPIPPPHPHRSNRTRLTRAKPHPTPRHGTRRGRTRTRKYGHGTAGPLAGRPTQRAGRNGPTTGRSVAVHRQQAQVLRHEDDHQADAERAAEPRMWVHKAAGGTGGPFLGAQ